MYWSSLGLAFATPTASLPALPEATAVPMTLAVGAWAQAPVMHRSLAAPADTTPQNVPDGNSMILIQSVVWSFPEFRYKQHSPLESDLTARLTLRRQGIMYGSTAPCTAARGTSRKRTSCQVSRPPAP